MAKMKRVRERGDGLTLGYNAEIKLKKPIRIILKRKKSIRGKIDVRNLSLNFLVPVLV